MTRQDMIDAVERLFYADGSEDELHILRQKLKEIVPHGNISDLIFYPEVELTAEQTVDEALWREAEHVAQTQRATA